MQGREEGFSLVSDGVNRWLFTLLSRNVMMIYKMLI